MTTLSDLASFAVVAGLLTIIPGLDTALVVRTAVAHGREQGFAVALGISTGVLIWGAAAAVGVSELLVASRLAYNAVRFAGAAYLVWLGGAMLWHSWRRRASADTASADTARADTADADADAVAGRAPCPVAHGRFLRSWSRGVATNLLNPKIGVFYVAILPQFIPARAPHLLMGLALAGVHDAEGIAWFTMLFSAAYLTRRFLGSDRVHKIMDRITGTVLIGFGLKLALSQR